ncbi:MAG TPA: dockerin type I domain-containing protein [Candidatus Polarisedimenticolaceae bacterium]|nr:dockerin type I domain-containing protein [Candidatus Polarisedimenticolaceae bacterium]
MPRRVAYFLLASILCVARAQAASGAADERVRQAALQVYIHGMTDEIARNEVGVEGVPALLRLLDDPSFPRRDNVVAFLAYLGSAESTPRLLDLLGRPAASATPEEVRSRLLVPHALGHIAGRGDAAALRALLRMTADRAEGGPLAGLAMKDELLDTAVASLALAGPGPARERLEAIAQGRVVPDPEQRRLESKAREAMASSADSLRRLSSASAAAAMDYIVDPATHTTAHGLTFANHVSVTNPMTETRLDAVLADATFRAAKGDFSTDVACCTIVSRVAAAQTFGTATDGLASIDTAQEVNTVLAVSVARVKVVNVINYCGGAGTNIIGCSYQPGWGMALVRLSDVGYEAVLWIHEYGHNLGLPHVTPPASIMAPNDNGQNDGLSPTECATFHSPASDAVALLGDGGTCTNDGDSYADPIDNCPFVANESQADSNHNGIGDACEAGTTADIDGNGRVDGLDLARLGRAFGSSTGEAKYDAAADLDHNGQVDGADLAILTSQFGNASS